MKKEAVKTRTIYDEQELSWLKFNERVLNEAGNPRVPLAERLTFLRLFINLIWMNFIWCG